MDADKLNEAAIAYAKKNTTALNPFGRIMDDFKAGADWVLSQLLADRLTKEEKEKIKIEYAELLKAQRKARQDRDTFYGNILSAQRGIYESIFGKELFNEK